MPGVTSCRGPGRGTRMGGGQASGRGRVLRIVFSCCCVLSKPAMSCSAGRPRSALALLVAQVLADDHDPPVTADHLALVADLLDARLDLHCLVSFRSVTPVRAGTGLNGIRGKGIGSVPGGLPETVVLVVLVLLPVSGSGRRCARETGRTARVPPRPGPRGGSGCSAGASCPRCARAPCDRWSVPP